MNWRWWQSELQYEPEDKISVGVLTLVNSLVNDPDNWLFGVRTVTSRSEINFYISLFDTQPNIGERFNKEEQQLVTSAIQKLIIKKATGDGVKLGKKSDFVYEDKDLLREFLALNVERININGFWQAYLELEKKVRDHLHTTTKKTTRVNK